MPTYQVHHSETVQYVTTVEAETMEELQEAVRAIDDDGDFDSNADCTACTEREIECVNKLIGLSVVEPVARELWAS